LIDYTRKDIPVKHERRRYPRLDFHCSVMVTQMDALYRVTGLSLGGVFIEMQDLDTLRA
jgi:hypothetical protein